MHILLAEDNYINQQLALRILTKRGHEVTVVEDGQEAVDALQSNPQTFDLVLMDIQMPRMDGFAATAAIRAQELEQGGHIPIVAMTAHALKEDRARCLEAGMDGYVAKPIDIKELIDVVGALTGVAKTDAPPQAGRGAGGDEDAVDWMRAVEKLGGDEFLLGELATIFLDAYPEMLSEVRTALEQDDAPALQRAAHRLRGSVGNFVARRAIACSERVEEIAETGSLTEAADAVTQLEASLAQMRIALERRVGGHGA